METIMARYNTNNPVPSTAMKDLSDNAQIMDEFANSVALTTLDRLGEEKYTYAGLINLVRQMVGTLGWAPLPDVSFEIGATLTDATQALKYEADDNYYRWDGDFDKVVPAGSTPDSTGGVVQGAWVNVSDLTLRTALASSDDGKGAGLVGAVGGGTVQSELDTRQKILRGSSATPTTGYPIPSYINLIGDYQGIGIIGATYVDKGSVKKTGNATFYFSNQDSNATPITVDAIAYIQPQWVSDFYPQQTKIESVCFMGDPASNNQCGLFIFQGGKYSLKDITVVNAKYGLWLKDAWISDITNVRTLGSIRQSNGTSITYNNCWARGNTEREGAFDFTGLKYSVLNGCASDGAVNTAYAFDYCDGVTLNGCGCEGATTITSDRGTALAFKNGCTMTVNNFACVPVAGQTIGLMTFGDSNIVTINGFISSFNNTVYNAPDIYIYGNNTTVEVRMSRFRNTGTSVPIVQIAAGVNSKVVVHLADGKKRIYTAGINVFESMVDSGTYTPNMLVAGATRGDIVYASRTGTFSKTGNIVSVSVDMTLSTKSATSGLIQISLPYAATGVSTCKVDYTNMSGTGFYGFLNASNSSIILKLDAATSATNALNQTHITNTSRIAFSITYATTSLF